ncbi:Pre-mRNA-splicing factor slt11 [Malassezia yamatoensis]|uniref:Pre-mRNA-splicing factor slt11 n=1 Tax=Malassezia yamatoensis TaxID=253288 RepID=A0AAJ5YYK2_9BASI|nr:Pre-mRNA-splicing factor slt11 [Malassezia yamatoensis]
MSRQHLGKECKVCGRPFTVFRWNPGAGMRFKKTEICTTCAKLKHACQTCILDLDYHLPTHVRDSALHIQSAIPTSDINRQYYVNRMEAQMDGDTVASQFGPKRITNAESHTSLSNLSSNPPDPHRHRPQVCSFYARGSCKRGDACPYRHEVQPSSSAPSVADQYAQVSKQLEKPVWKPVDQARPLVPPSNEEILSLFFTNLPDLNQDSMQDSLLATVAELKKDDIQRVQYIEASHCAFIHFKTRQAAERVANALAVKVEMHGHQARVAWGRSASQPN